MHGGQVRAQRVEVVQRRTGTSAARGAHLLIGRVRRGRQVAVPVVRTVDPHGREDLSQSVDLAQEVLSGEPALAQLLGQRVRRRRDRHPALHQLRQQPRDQRRVAWVVELELVDAHARRSRPAARCIDEAEDPGQLGQLPERARTPSARRRPRHRDRRREQVRLADTEPAVEVEAHTGQHLAPAEQLLLAARRCHRQLAELLGTTAPPPPATAPPDPAGRCRSSRRRTSAAGPAGRPAAWV